MIKVIHEFDCVFGSQGYDFKLISWFFMGFVFYLEGFEAWGVVRSVGLLATF